MVKRDISNRVGRDITLDPGVASRFSGGPIFVDHKVVGIVMSNQGQFGKGITHKSMLDYMEGFGVMPSSFPIVEEPGSSTSPTPVVPTTQPAPSREPLSPSLPTTKTGKDGAPMVLVPTGAFTMGSPDGEGDSDEHPQHTVDLDAFYIDQIEVTVERYKRFMPQTNRANPNHWDQVKLSRDGQKPVVGINWDNARAYCEWAGKRVPTEA